MSEPYLYRHDPGTGEVTFSWVTIESRQEADGVVAYTFAPVSFWTHRLDDLPFEDHQFIRVSALIDAREEHGFRHEYLVPKWGFGDS